MKKFTYSFEEGNKDMKELLGGKGSNLAEMKLLNIPVPPGFIITTKTCDLYYKNDKSLTEQMKNQINLKIKELEKISKKKLGDNNNPLLVSVRSGAEVSMPGMMDTVLNLGLNDKSVDGLTKKTKNQKFALDSYRRFIQMFGNVVLGISASEFEEVLEEVKLKNELELDTDLSAEDLQNIVNEFKEIVEKKTGKEFPQSPSEQLYMAIEAVFDSWNNDRAVTYRRLNGIYGLLGTAVSIQEMVFGNMGETSGTGVCFSRNPSTGEKKFYGEYLMNAQGEDVVAGVRTPLEIDTLKNQNPEIYKELAEIKDKLENHYKDVQDMEFTIQEGKLYFLQTRNGKRTAAAAIKIAVDLVNEGILSKKEALLKIEANSLNQLLHKQFCEKDLLKSTPISTGLAASPGAAVGEIVFTAVEACEKKSEGKNVILVRKETSPEDIEGINSACGILTSTGGMTSHAAVVARGMGKCCVSGCDYMIVDEKTKTLTVNGREFTSGDVLSLDGSTGKVYSGEIVTRDSELSNDFVKIMKWSDEFRRLKIRTNADTGSDAKKALEFGAEGIGLCRTEHMFFDAGKIKCIREMILANDLSGRKKAVAKLLPLQEKDFKELFRSMNGLPVNVRLLDPPLHEFLPKEKKEIKELAEEMGVSQKRLKQKISELYEVNPMLGHRGCRLGITYPEITEMQATAIFKAVKEESVDIEIMIPLIGNVKEFANQKKVIEGVAKKVGVSRYKTGVMIEVPRAALTADEIAREAEFFSFGTNDLTQMTLGFSRDDSGKFVEEYIKKGIYNDNPFEKLEQTGVGELMKIAIEKGRSERNDLKLGICGEHGGEPESIEFCHKIGLDYVSCSPFRVPIARLAAAQSAIKSK